MYIHLAIAYSSNIENLFSLCKVPFEAEPISKDSNLTNIINAWTIVEGAKAVNEKKDETPVEKEEILFRVLMVKGAGGLAGTVKLTLSYEYAHYCIKSKGRMDIHFQSYILNLLPTNQYPRLLAYCKNPKLYTEGYSAKMIEIIANHTETNNMKQWAS